MFITSQKIGLSLLALLLVSGTAWSAAIQGTVTGPDGKAIAGAEVRLDRADKKGAPNIIKTDNHGQYSFNKIDVGTYKLVAAAKDMATTGSNNVKARADGAVRVDFALKKETAAAAAPKKKTHKVWVHADTGSNIGGRWVDVPDDQATGPAVSSTPGVNNMSRGGNAMVRGMQQSGGGGNNSGGN